ncbi:lysoplasmalogenase family protein [Deinococcus aquaedulcis]|uniref:lysoplasmalogenase family protein n=1 Tax=Deinococcus aquaedulcis TaxID=2840455 RepID=UPI001C83A935|nr:lysoplasmalogenase family protein [Deinococcus aquaedulcis]
MSRWPFRLGAAATVAAGMADHARAHQTAETSLILALMTEVLAQAPARSRTDTALLLGALGASGLGGLHIATATHLPDPQGYPAGFRRGAAWYALAQTAYLGLLWRHGARPHAGAWPLRLGAAGLGLGLLLRHDRASLPTLSGYGTLLSGMALLAADPRLAPAAGRALRVGGWLFVASDLLILVRRYLLRGRLSRALAEGLMLALYASAQRRLMDGLLELTRQQQER